MINRYLVYWRNNRVPYTFSVPTINAICIYTICGLFGWMCVHIDIYLYASSIINVTITKRHTITWFLRETKERRIKYTISWTIHAKLQCKNWRIVWMNEWREEHTITFDWKQKREQYQKNFIWMAPLNHLSICVCVCYNVYDSQIHRFSISFWMFYFFHLWGFYLSLMICTHINVC